MNVASIVRFVAPGAVFCFLALVAPAHAAPYLTDTDIIPTPAGHAGKTDAIVWKQKVVVEFSGAGFEVTPTSLELRNAVGGAPPPPPGGTINSFFDIEYGWDWFVNQGGRIMPGSGTGTTAGKLFVGGLSYLPDGTAVYDTELLQLDLVGLNGLPPGVPEMRLRESPTKASTGKTSIRSLPGGQYLVDSFFDVFTELSLDGGQSWIPASGSMHLETVPEPSTAVLGALGTVIVCGWAASRKRR